MYEKNNQKPLHLFNELIHKRNHHALYITPSNFYENLTKSVNVNDNICMYNNKINATETLYIYFIEA